MDKPLLQVVNLHKRFRLRGRLGQHAQTLYAVNGVSLDVAEREVFCIVGESGCGKSTLARIIAGLLPPTEGSVYFKNTRVDNLSAHARRPYRRNLQMIFQNPQESLNPRMTVRQMLEEALRFHFPNLSRDEREAQMHKAMEDTGLPADALARYPHQFSGGQRQRISIARALIVRPQCIIADEPIAALDVSVQAQILNLLADLRDEHGLAYFFITHDLSVVERFGQRVAVMYLGAVCETATAKQLFATPHHPYTRTLLDAAPRIGKPFTPAAAGGEVPSPINRPSGCLFHPRCPHANDRCRQEEPQLLPHPATPDDATAAVACHAIHERRL